MTLLTVQPPEAPAQARPAKPDLFLPYAGLTVTDSAVEIFRQAALTRRFFRRGISVVRVVGRGTDAMLEPLNTQSARSAFDAVGRVIRFRRGRGGLLVPEQSLLTADDAGVLLACTEALFELPELVGTTKTPVLARTPDGPRLCAQGYSADLKLWVFSDMIVPEVPVEEAVRSLMALLEEFDFATPSDRSRAFAAFITPTLHLGNWLPGESVPVDVAEADQSQSGKTFRQKIVAAIYGDRPAYVNLKSKGVGGMDESIQSLIAEGKPFISIDNAKGSLDSEFLEQTLTNTTGLYRIRLPGTKEVQVRAKFIVQISSNKTKMSKDLANRSSIVRITKRLAYEFCSNPLATVEANPGYFLGCVASVVREWANRDCPQTAGVEHDFRKWAGASDWIVQNIAKLPPLLEGHRSAQTRTADPVLSFLREIGLAIEGQGDLGSSFSASQLLEIASSHSIELQGVDVNPANDDLKVHARKVLGIKLAPVFKASPEVVVDQFKIFRTEDVGERKDGKGSQSERRYQFTRPVSSGTKQTAQ
jgi:hypothetical protein